MADSNTTDDKIKTRTLVGSYPHRQQLRGREAVERALALCKAWPADPKSRVAFERDESPRGAAARAFWARWDAVAGDITEAPSVAWLPEELRDVLPGSLVARLACGCDDCLEVAP